MFTLDHTRRDYTHCGSCVEPATESLHIRMCGPTSGKCPEVPVHTLKRTASRSSVPTRSVTVVGGSTLLVAMFCEYLVEAVEPVTQELGIKQAFMATVRSSSVPHLRNVRRTESA